MVDYSLQLFVVHEKTLYTNLGGKEVYISLYFHNDEQRIELQIKAVQERSEPTQFWDQQIIDQW